MEENKPTSRHIKIRGLNGYDTKKRNITMIGENTPITQKGLNTSLASVQSALDELAATFSKIFKSDITLDYGKNGEIYIDIGGTAKKAVNNEYGEPIDTTYQRRDEMYFDETTGTLYWRDKQ